MWCQGVRSERESADGNLFNKRCDAWGVGRAAMDYKRTMTFWRITLRHDANRGEAHPFRSGCYTQHSDGGSFLKACLTKVKEWIGEPFRTCLVLQNALQTWAPGHPDQNLSTKDVIQQGLTRMPWYTGPPQDILRKNSGQKTWCQQGWLRMPWCTLQVTE